jgi:hypothetical protein
MFLPPHMDLTEAPLWMKLAYIALDAVQAVVMTGCAVVLFRASRKAKRA